jgi:large subunit ribosomal protein L24
MVGKDQGKQGKVVKVDSKKKTVLIEGLNLFKRHRKPKKSGQKGEIVSMPHFIDVSNVMLICPSCAKPARIGRKIEEDKIVRYCKKCKSLI